MSFRAIVNSNVAEKSPRAIFSPREGMTPAALNLENTESASAGAMPMFFAIANTSAMPAETTNSIELPKILYEGRQVGTLAQIPHVTGHLLQFTGDGGEHACGPRHEHDALRVPAHLRRHEHGTVQERDALSGETRHTRLRSGGRRRRVIEDCGVPPQMRYAARQDLVHDGIVGKRHVNVIASGDGILRRGGDHWRRSARGPGLSTRCDSRP